jgi:TRAP-type C4-dicarboxylate transport system, periplasmic component
MNQLRVNELGALFVSFLSMETRMEKGMKKTLWVVALAVLLFVGGTAFAGQKYRLKMSGQDAEGLPSTNAMHKIADEVNKRTDGAVSIKIYPSNQLGEAELQYQGVMDGSIDMLFGYVSPTYSLVFDVTTIPFLASGYKEIAYIASPESNCYKMFVQAAEENDMVFLGFFLNGVNGIFSVKPMGDYKNPDARKDVLVRIPNSVTYKMGLEAMGFPTVTIPWPDTYTSLQTGVMDGMTGIPSYMVEQNFGDITKYFYPLDMYMETNSIMMSPATKDKLPKEYFDVIQQVCSEIAAESLLTTEQNVNEGIAALAERGIEIYSLTDAERDEIATKVRGKTAAAVEQYFGKEILEKVQEDIANAVKSK